MRTKKCLKCGAENLWKNKTCYNCGDRIGAGQVFQDHFLGYFNFYNSYVFWLPSSLKKWFFKCVRCISQLIHDPFQFFLYCERQGVITLEIDKLYLECNYYYI